MTDKQALSGAVAPEKSAEKAALDKLTKRLTAMTAERNQARADLAAERKAHAVTRKESAQFKRQLSAQKTQTTKARNELAEVKAVERVEAARVRAIGPLDGPKLSARELQVLVQAATRVEVVASDGELEIMAIPPVLVTGDHAWVPKAHGLALTAMQYRVQGPGPGEQPHRIAGFGLVLDGELAAYCARPEPVAIGPNQTFNLAGDVIF